MADKIRVTEYDVFCGMDVDKRSIAGAFLEWDGRMRQVTLPNNAEVVVKYVSKHYEGKRILFVYEAGPTGYGLYDGLEARGRKCLIAAPSMISRAPGQRVKTNRLDARRLAINLRGGEIQGIHVPSGLYRDLRHLVQWRDVCVREVGRRQRRIKSLLLLEGMDFPAERWSQEAIERLRQQQREARSVVGYKLRALLKSLHVARREARDASMRLRGFSRKKEELNRCMGYLMSVPAIGWITASHFLARVGDWRELEAVKKTCGFLGLGPSEHSTGKRVVRGQITGVGDRRLRAKLIQCAWRGIRVDESLATVFVRIWRTNPPQFARQKAIVAVTRLLVCRLHAVLRDQRYYCESPDHRATRGSFPGTDPAAPQSEGSSGRTHPEARFCRKGSRESAPELGADQTQCDGPRAVQRIPGSLSCAIAE